MFFKLTKLIKIISEPFFIYALFNGAAAGVEQKSVLKTLGEIRHVVDIGANRGQFALVCRKLFHQVRIDSFEPLEGPAEIFRKVFSKDTHTTLHQYAIGPREEKAIIHISKRDDSSSLLPISKLQSTLFPNTEETETQTIQVCPLDKMISKSDINSPALLKLDVQGYELAALAGCKSLLPSFEHIYVECSFVELYEGQALAHQVIDFLHQEQFVLIGIYNMYYDQNGKAIQADFLFKQRNGKDTPASCAS